jgi:hypothetical protein
MVGQWACLSQLTGEEGECGQIRRQLKYLGLSKYIPSRSSGLGLKRKCSRKSRDSGVVSHKVPLQYLGLRGPVPHFSTVRKEQEGDWRKERRWRGRGGRRGKARTRQRREAGKDTREG